MFDDVAKNNFHAPRPGSLFGLASSGCAEHRAVFWRISYVAYAPAASRPALGIQTRGQGFSGGYEMPVHQLTKGKIMPDTPPRLWKGPNADRHVMIRWGTRK
jgi:hypothetical protein